MIATAESTPIHKTRREDRARRCEPIVDFPTIASSLVWLVTPAVAVAREALACDSAAINSAAINSAAGDPAASGAFGIVVDADEKTPATGVPGNWPAT
jgi:hypothetical protein